MEYNKQTLGCFGADMALLTPFKRSFAPAILGTFTGGREKSGPPATFSVPRDAGIGAAGIGLLEARLSKFVDCRE